MSTNLPPGSRPRDFVLVHGAWHGGWCWELVRERIEAAGHRVHTPTLPGLGDRADELDAAIGLADHIADVTDYIAARDLRDIVLAGHSYGGMVITGVADALKSRIAHILYLDAALPENGQSMISYGTPRPPEAIAATEAGLRSRAPDGIAMAALPPPLLGIPASHPLHDDVAAQLTPHPLKTWLDTIRLVNGGPAGLPRTYVHCTAPVMAHTQFPAIARMAKADPDWDYAELATGHEAMLTAPGDVAKLLLDRLAPLRHPRAQSHRPQATAQEQA
ncbi:alpha/beta fold hydrolase [Erythrobacter sp.]|uniref:alpha/beta fold hydrolase n=1 Tax=Erythrobacter sp. TaxID=1042 RepID=UPI0025E84A37|nr:alpha/beta fold hydrolase [Erythrobacter sp.]